MALCQTLVVKRYLSFIGKLRVYKWIYSPNFTYSMIIMSSG